MSSIGGRGGVKRIRLPSRYAMPFTSPRGRPCAISAQAWSNSPTPTQSTAPASRSEASGSTATWAPTIPTRSCGFSPFSRSATRRSLPKEGVLVCITTWSYSRASGATWSTVRPSGGASTSRLPGTSAAGCASHVGYQNDRISRRA